MIADYFNRVGKSVFKEEFQDKPFEVIYYNIQTGLTADDEWESSEKV